MSNKAGLGIVGLGWWGRVLANSVESGEHGEIVACFARTDDVRNQFASDFDCTSSESLEALLADERVEGVVFATPHTLHREHIELAAAAGVNVFVEKPFTMTAEDGRAAIAAAEAGGIKLMVGHQRRRQTTNRRIRAMIDNGEIGTPLHGESSFFVPKGFPDSWRATREETPMGGMTGLGVHSLDTFHYLLGPVAQVSAFNNPVIPDAPLDHATGLLLNFESGAVATLITSHYAPMTNRLVIYGDAGAGFNEEDGKRLYVQSREEMAKNELEIEPNDPIVEQLDEFAQAIRGEATIETAGAEGLAVIQVLEAAIASSKSGKAENISDF